jgi:CBS domain-containing protein
MRAKDILSSKGRNVFTLVDEASVFEAVKILTDNKIGFLVILNAAGGVTGVLSERDVIQKCIFTRHDPEQLKVSEIMTPKYKIISATEDEHIQSIMNTMTEKKIRHIPIFNGEQLSGVISIGDVIKHILQAKDNEIKSLSEYVSGNYPG